MRHSLTQLCCLVATVLKLSAYADAQNPVFSANLRALASPSSEFVLPDTVHLVIFGSKEQETTRLPVRSALFKHDTGGLVVKWVTISESLAVVCFSSFWPLFLAFWRERLLDLFQMLESIVIVSYSTYDQCTLWEPMTWELIGPFRAKAAIHYSVK
jgi:hypothetical protein